MNKNKLKEFLEESNAIEREYSDVALQDALQAWTCGAIILQTEEFTLGLVLAIHRRLLKRLYPEVAGKIRDVPVYIGGHVKDQSKEEIKKELQLLFNIWNTTNFASMNDKEKIEFIKDWHVKFEKIHPFIDGNGRTGRILMNLQRLSVGLPLLIIHDGPEQFAYYKWFKEEKYGKI